MAARRFYVTGRVQGVFFRASTRAEARRLGIVGRALNLEDGRVEVLAVGPDENIAQLAAWLEHGPTHARVDRVEVVELDSAGYEGLQEFTTG